MKRTFSSALVFVAAAVSAAAAEMIAVGQAFPVWSLKDHTGALVSSEGLAGKPYLLWFYPAALTPGCTTEGRGLRDEIDAYRKAGIEILGVSFDPPARNAEFVKAESFPFRLLSDQERTLAMKIGAASSASQGYASRISYLVGPDGKVIEAYASVDPSQHATEVLEDFSSSDR